CRDQVVWILILQLAQREVAAGTDLQRFCQQRWRIKLGESVEATQMLFAIGSEVETKLIHPAPKAYRRKGIAQGSPLRHVHHDSATCHQRQTKLLTQLLQDCNAPAIGTLQQ